MNSNLKEVPIEDFISYDMKNIGASDAGKTTPGTVQDLNTEEMSIGEKDNSVSNMASLDGIALPPVKKASAPVQGSTPADPSAPKTGHGPGKFNLPWWSQECQEAISKKKKAYRKYLRTKLPSDKVELKKARSHARRIIKIAKGILPPDNPPTTTTSATTTATTDPATTIPATTIPADTIPAVTISQ